MVIIDLADFSSVVAFADQAECELGRLNILVQNTGVATWEHEQVEGWERTYVASSMKRRGLTIFLACIRTTSVPVYSPSV